MFKTIVRTFCDQKVNFSPLINRDTVLGLLKDAKRSDKLTYAEIARKFAKSEVSPVGAETFESLLKGTGCCFQHLEAIASFITQ